MANAISEAFKLVKANLLRFPMTVFQEEYIPSCHARRICNSVSKYS